MMSSLLYLSTLLADIFASLHVYIMIVSVLSSMFLIFCHICHFK